MKNIPIFEYIKRVDGTSKFKDFLDSLSEKDAAKNKLVKKLETNLYKLRSKMSSNFCSKCEKN